MRKQFIKNNTYPKDNLNYAPTVCFRKCFMTAQGVIDTVFETENCYGAKREGGKV